MTLRAARSRVPYVVVGVGLLVVLVLALLLTERGGGTTAGDALVSVEVTPATVAGCRNARGTVTLHRSAPPGGTVVELAATDPALVVPDRVRVAAGERTADFPVASERVDEPVPAEVVATDVEGAAVRTQVAVRPIGVTGLHLASSTVPEGTSVEATAVLDCPAGSGGLTVAVSSSEPGLAAPAAEQVAVPAGRREAVVTLTTGRADDARAARVTATANGVSASEQLTVTPRTYGQPERTGVFDAEQVPEASGVAASRRNPGWLYVVDDERPREVWAMRPDGSALQPVPLTGFEGRDTEDVAVAPCSHGDPQSCVYVGDIGDNAARHPDVAILRFAEPDLSAPVDPVAPEVIRVRYPDGPVNAEALLVDGGGVPHIMTKEADTDGRSTARLFAADGFVDGTLVDHGPVPVPDPAQPWVAAVLGTLVTGADYRQGRVLLRTYDAVIEYVAPDPSASLADFGSWTAREVPSARAPQSEAVGFAADGCGYYTVSEMAGDIWFVDCRAAESAQ